MTIKEMREKRVNLASKAQALLDRAAEESRDLSAEESAQFDSIHEEIDSLKRQIDRLERQNELETELRESQGTAAGAQATAGATDTDGNRQSQNQEEERAKAFRNWLVGGMGGLTPEQREIMAKRQSALPQEARALAAGVDTAGGYTVDDEFVTRIETAMKAYSGIRNTRATIMRTTGGNPMPMPTSDDTSNKGARVGENTQASEQDMSFGSKILKAHMYTSNILRVSIQFLQDTSIANIEAWLAERLGERIGRITAEEFITGTGSDMPEGLATAATLGATGASVDGITYEDFVDLEHSVNPAYRRQAEWLLGDGIVRTAKKLKDGQGRPLWVPGVAVREPDTILGYRYAIDMEIPDPAAEAKTMYFGDFSKFHIRDVKSMQMLRLAERYADYLQVGFLVFSRHDSALLDAGTNPIKYFQHASA